jgi:hypothetical protein
LTELGLKLGLLTNSWLDYRSITIYERTSLNKMVVIPSIWCTTY